MPAFLKKNQSKKNNGRSSRLANLVFALRPVMTVTYVEATFADFRCSYTFDELCTSGAYKTIDIYPAFITTDGITIISNKRVIEADSETGKIVTEDKTTYLRYSNR